MTTRISILLLFCLLFLAGSGGLIAQTRATDSLTQLLHNAKSDTARINRAVTLVTEFSQVNIDTAVALGLRYIDDARKIPFPQGEARLRAKLAFAYCFKGEWDLAQSNLSSAQDILTNLNDSVNLAALYNTWGAFYGMQSRYDSAIIFGQKAVDIAEHVKAFQVLETAYQNMAASYQMQSNFPQALYFMQKGLRLAEQTGNINSQAYLNLNMGSAYRGVSEFTKAELALLRAVTLAKSCGATIVELYAYSNLCAIYDSRQDYQLSYKYASKGMELAKQVGDKGMEATNHSWAALAMAYMQRFKEAELLGKKALILADSSRQPLNIYQANASMGQIYNIMGRYKESIPYYENGFSVLKDASIYDAQVGSSYHQLSEAYEKTGNYKKALDMAKIARQISDSISNRENVRKSTELDMSYQFSKKEEIQKAAQEKKDAVTHAQKVTLTIGLALTFMLAAFAFWAYRSKARTNAQLESQKAEIEKTLAELKAVQAQLIQSEKMASLGELTAGIAHEIQNPLNFVNNFSDLNGELIAEMKEALDKGNIEEARLIANDVSVNEEKINHHGKRADGIVKGMLQHSRSSNGVKEPTDINSLVDEYLRLAYHGLRAKDKTFNATLETFFDPAAGKTDIVPQDMGRVILNLITNAFYTVTEKKKQLGTNAPYEPTVTVRTKKINGRVEIKVKDSGNGIPEKIRDKIFQPFFTTKPTGQGTGLGLSLSYEIVTKAHGGELKVESKEGDFTEFTVILPE